MAPKIDAVSVGEFAAMWGVTAQRVYQWVQSGMPHRAHKDGTRIVPREANPWLRDRAVSEALKGTDLDEEKERIRERRAAAGLKELELRERSGEVVPRKEWAAYLEAFIGGFAAAAAGELQRFEREILRVNNAAEARELTQKIRSALMSGAHRYADQLTEEADALIPSAPAKRKAG